MFKRQKSLSTSDVGTYLTRSRVKNQKISIVEEFAKMENERAAAKAAGKSVNSKSGKKTVDGDESPSDSNGEFETPRKPPQKKKDAPNENENKNGEDSHEGESPNDESDEDDSEERENEKQKKKKKKKKRIASDSSSDSDMKIMKKLLIAMSNDRKKSFNPNVMQTCKTLIINFKAENVSNFLSSVRDAIDEVGEENAKKVLNYAKTRVEKSTVISQQEYSDFKKFERDVLTEFKPPQNLSQMTLKVSLMIQEEDNVTEYGKKATLLKENYLSAIVHYYKDCEVPKRRLQEAEDLLIDRFVTGLKSYVRGYMNGKQKTLALAISAAREAESCARVAKFATAVKEKTKQNDDKNKKNNNAAQAKKPFIKNREYVNNKTNDDGAQKKSDGQSSSDYHCFNCGGKGHISKYCKKQKATKVGAYTKTENEETKNGNAGSSGSSVSASTLRILQHR